MFAQNNIDTLSVAEYDLFSLANKSLDNQHVYGNVGLINLGQAINVSDASVFATLSQKYSQNAVDYQIIISQIINNKVANEIIVSGELKSEYLVNGKLVIPAILDQVIDISLNNNYMVTLEVINGPLEESTYNYNFSLVDTISKTITIVDEKGAVLESIDVSSKFGTDLEIELPSIEGFVPLEGDYKYIVDFNSADDITITYREVI